MLLLKSTLIFREYFFTLSFTTEASRLLSSLHESFAEDHNDRQNFDFSIPY